MIDILIYSPLIILGLGIIGYILPISVFLIRELFLFVKNKILKIKNPSKYNANYNHKSTEPVSNNDSKVVNVESIFTNNANNISVDNVENTGVKNKSVALNDLNKNMNKLRAMRSIINKLNTGSKKDSMKEDYDKFKAKVLGDYEIIEYIKNMDKNMKYFYDITINYNREKIQFDFILLTNDMLYVIDTSLLRGDIYIDKKGVFFYTDKDGHTSIIDNPIDNQKRKCEKLINKFKELGIELNIPIQSGIVLANKEATIKVQKEVKGLYLDYKKFLNEIKESGLLYFNINRAGYLLKDSIISKEEDYIEIYNIKQNDFNPIA